MSDKTVEELSFPEEIRYHPEHTWAKIEGGLVRVGITDFAQDSLGPVVFVELPGIGDEFDKDEVFGCVESAKTVSDLYMPVSGRVEAVNHQLEESPDLVNTDPYGSGWIILINPRDPADIDNLLTRDGYVSLLKEA
ncbi:MAG: glycine cleavage system protein GcvH [Peptococcaceae bacterium]|nr:glycine cleavage system protein GcvH [Peptococcaceae bacterium]